MGSLCLKVLDNQGLTFLFLHAITQYLSRSFRYDVFVSDLYYDINGIRVRIFLDSVQKKTTWS